METCPCHEVGVLSLPPADPPSPPRLWRTSWEGGGPEGGRPWDRPWLRRRRACEGAGQAAVCPVAALLSHSRLLCLRRALLGTVTAEARSRSPSSTAQSPVLGKRGLGLLAFPCCPWGPVTGTNGTPTEEVCPQCRVPSTAGPWLWGVHVSSGQAPGGLRWN